MGMEASLAEIEQAASALAARAHLVEMLVHGCHIWQVEIGGLLYTPDTLDVDIIDGGLTVTIGIDAPEAPGDWFGIHADYSLVYAVPGRIVQGKPARLRMRFSGAPMPAGV